MREFFPPVYTTILPIIARTDYAYTKSFSDGNCQVPVDSQSDQLRCSNLLGAFRSAQGMCNAVTSRLPLPSSTFVTNM